MSNIKTVPFSHLSSEAFQFFNSMVEEWKHLHLTNKCDSFNKAYLLSLDWCLQNNHRLLQVTEVLGVLMVTYIEGGDNCTTKLK